MQPSVPSQLVSLCLQCLVKARSSVDLLPARAALESWVPPILPCGMRVEPVETERVRGEWLKPGGCCNRSKLDVPRSVVLYLHGGGYCMCSPKTHRALTSMLSEVSHLPVMCLRYRLAPENPFPAALEDALAAYRWLLAQGFTGDRIALAGDSAGGGLVLATMLAARAEGLPLPATAALFSPWTDLACTGASLVTNEATCVMFTADLVREGAALYLGGHDPYDPLVSPLYGDLRGLPPMLVQVSDSETLLDDATRLVHRAREQGVNVQLKIWPRLPHVWQLFPHIMPEARTSLSDAALFLLGHLPHCTSAVRFDKLILGD